MTWNICHASDDQAYAVAEMISQHSPDVAVLTEYRRRDGGRLEKALADVGLPYQLTSEPPPNTNGILVAAKAPLELVQERAFVPEVAHRWLEVRIPTEDITILGLHVPGSGDKWGKKPFWEAVVRYAEARSKSRVCLAGDFNTGFRVDAEGTPFTCSRYMARLLELGWIDAWRSLHPDVRDFTWTYHRTGNGFRLDYVFLSPALSTALGGAVHSHEERAVSDHSSLVVGVE